MAAAIAGRAPDLLFCLGLTKFLISCLRVRILRSTWPFICWWYCVAIQTWIPRDFYICDQNLEVKRESWSRTMLRGRPWTSKIVLLSFLKIFSEVVFVTGRGGAGFHTPGGPLHGAGGGIFWVIPTTPPLEAHPHLFPGRPRLLPPIFNGDPSGVWVGRGPEPGQGQGMPKKTPRPRPFSGAERGKGLGARVFQRPVRPVTNSILR